MMETKNLNLEKDVLKIFINGEELKYFSNIKLSDKYDAIANGLIFNIPNNTANRNIFTPFKYTKIKCYLGSQILINGFVMKIEVSDIYTLTITAYNHAQQMITSNLSPESYPRTFDNSSLETICSKLLEGLNIKYSASPSGMGYFKKEYKAKEHIEYEQKIGEFLIKLAQQRNLIIKADNNTGGIVFDLYEKSNIVLDLVAKKIYNDFNIIYDGEIIYSELYGLRGKTHKEKEEKAKIENSFIKSKRVFVKTMSSGEKETLTDLIKNEDKKQKKDLFTVRINYPEVYDNNKELIQSGKLLILKNPEFYINKEVVFMIFSVEYDLDKFTCTIEAQPVSIFNNEAMNIFWE